MKQPHFFTLLTQEEFKLLFSLVFVSNSDYFKDAYPIADYPSPGYEGRSRDILEHMLRAARYLGLGHGYQFEGLLVRDNGSVGGPVVEPGNENYVDMLKNGGLPNLPLAFETAIAALLRHDPSFDVGPLRSALAQVREDLGFMDKWAMDADPEGIFFEEIRNRRRDAYDEASKLLGLKPSKEIVH